MAPFEDYVLSLLTARFRALPLDRLRTCAGMAARRGLPLADAFVAERLLTSDEAAAFRSAAGFLTAGQFLWACARCLIQLVRPADGAPAACPNCSRPLQKGVLPKAATVVFDAALERRVRRIVRDGSARARTCSRLDQVDALRREGKLRGRPEAALAPKDAACAAPALGPYRLLALAGRGSSSYVYKAEDRRDARIVALKVLHFRPEENAESQRKKLARFEREAALASALEHPNLVPAGPLELVEGRTCIPMAFIDGPTLAQVLDARAAAGVAGESPEGVLAALELRGLADSLCDVARGLHYAHCRGVVHRDVTPRNILFSPSGDALLGDFGLARPIEGSSDLTGKDKLGSVEYVAPERLESESRAEPRSDVYSLGVVLFEILAGHAPPKRVAAGQVLELLRASTAGAQGLPPVVLAGLGAAIGRALEPAPERRFESALDFAQAVADAWAEDGADEAAAAADTTAPAGPTPVVAVPAAGGGPRSGRPRAAALAAAFLAGTALCAVTLTGLAYRSEAAALAEAQAAIERMLASATDPEYLDRREAALDALARAEGSLGRTSAAACALRARFEWTQGDWSAAAASYERAAALSGGGPERNRARLGCALAEFLLAQRPRAAGAGKPFAEAVATGCAALVKDAPDTWEGTFARALRTALGTGPAAARDELAPAVERAPDRSEGHVLLAWLRLASGDAPRAIQCLDAARAARDYDASVRLLRVKAWVERGVAGSGGGWRRVAPADAARAMTVLWPRLFDARLLLARALFDASAWAEAAAAAGDALALDPSATGVERLRAKALLRAGDLYGAVAAFTGLLAGAPDDAGSLYERAQVYLTLGDRSRAEHDLHEYLERFPSGPYATQARGYFALPTDK